MKKILSEMGLQASVYMCKIYDFVDQFELR